MFDELRHFLLILEHGTFTEAARHAHLSQPALTASIRRLEDELGARLLERDRRGARATAAGRELVPRARAAIAAVEDGRRAVRDVLRLAAGEVRLGGGATACTYLLPPAVAELRRRHPGLHLHVREATSAVVREAVEAGELDLGVVAGEATEPWVQDELVVVSAPGVAAGAPFVTLARGSTTRELFERHFPGEPVAVELGGLETVKAYVQAGIGRALLSRRAVRAELGSRRLVRVPDPRTPIPRPLALFHRGLERLSPAAAKTRELLLARR